MNLSDNPELVRDVFIMSVMDTPKSDIAKELDIKEGLINEILQDMEVATNVQRQLHNMINEINENSYAS